MIEVSVEGVSDPFDSLTEINSLCQLLGDIVYQEDRTTSDASRDVER